MGAGMRLGKREREAKRAIIRCNLNNLSAIADEQRLHGLRSTADADGFNARTHRNGYGAGMSTSRTATIGSGVVNMSRSRF